MLKQKLILPVLLLAFFVGCSDNNSNKPINNNFNEVPDNLVGTVWKGDYVSSGEVTGARYFYFLTDKTGEYIDRFNGGFIDTLKFTYVYKNLKIDMTSIYGGNIGIYTAKDNYIMYCFCNSECNHDVNCIGAKFYYRVE